MLQAPEKIGSPYIHLKFIFMKVFGSRVKMIWRGMGTNVTIQQSQVREMKHSMQINSFILTKGY